MRPATPKPGNSPIVARLAELKSARAVPIASLVVPATNNVRWVDWAYMNSNRLYVLFDVQKAPSPKGPWTTLTNGMLEPFSPAVFRSWVTNGEEFYRVGFRWP